MSNKADKQAKARAQAYKQQRERQEIDRDAEPSSEETRPKIRNEQDFQDLVGRRIEEAIRNGAFDNLRGKGKPLNLQRNPFVPEDMEMAYSIMQNNDIAPGWILDRKETQRAIDQFRARLSVGVQAYYAVLQTAKDAAARGRIAELWHGQLRQWETELGELNRRIGLQNIKQPLPHLEIFKLRMEDELTRAGLTN
jgi:DnaJ family protein C protein 28